MERRAIAMSTETTPTGSLRASVRSAARPAKYVFGRRSFTSKKAVAAHATSIRSRYDRGASITLADDLEFLSELFACNVEANQKRGAGIKRFYWDWAPQYSTPCFWIERAEEKPTEFGVPACLERIGRLNRQALRAAVNPEISAFRNRRLASAGSYFVSDFSGKSFPVEEAEADHVTPFNEIVAQFFGTRGIDIENHMLTRAVDAQSEPVWRDDALIAAFCEFHRPFPLRLVHSRENQSDIKRSPNQLRTPHTS
jgi:hypothetical protein